MDITSRLKTLDPDRSNEVSENQDSLGGAPEVFHQAVLNEVIEKLNQKRLVLIKGPSRSGKSTFLQEVLAESIRKNNRSVVYCSLMMNSAGEIVNHLQSDFDFVLIDEFYHLSNDSSLIQPLQERINSGKSVVLCGTIFDDFQEGKYDQLENQLNLSSENTVEFPLNMSEKDAKKVIQQSIDRFGGNSSDFKDLIDQLVALTTNPKVLTSIVADLFHSKMVHKPGFQLDAYLKDALENRLYFEKSLQKIAAQMRQKLAMV